MLQFYGVTTALFLVWISISSETTWFGFGKECVLAYLALSAQKQLTKLKAS